MNPLMLVLVVVALSGCAWVDDAADRYGACDGHWHGAKHKGCPNRSIRDAV